jgi:hypothetical protein
LYQYVTDYYIATTAGGSSIHPALAVLSTSEVTGNEANSMLGQFLNPSAATGESVQDTVFAEPVPSRTWGDWFMDKVAMQLQCSLSAVMVARWLSGAMFGKLVDLKVSIGQAVLKCYNFR